MKISFFLIWISLSALALAQTWTDTQGRNLEADFVSLVMESNQPTGVQVSRNGQALFIKWELLSAASQQQAQELNNKHLENQQTIYNSLVAPILERNCYKCHGEKKQKGELRVDSYAALLKGGKSGRPAIVEGSHVKSILFQRASLPEVHEDVMPPKGEDRPERIEIQFLKWWLKQGKASNETPLSKLPEEYKELVK